jgi:hypothetical protein
MPHNERMISELLEVGKQLGVENATLRAEVERLNTENGFLATKVVKLHADNEKLHDLLQGVIAQRDTHLKGVGRLQAWVNDLQSETYVNCVYCGHRYGPNPCTPVAMADILKEHIEQCPQHPMGALKKQVEQLEAKCAEMLHLIRLIDVELTDGEQGPSETICKIAEKMEVFQRMADPGQHMRERLKKADKVWRYVLDHNDILQNSPGHFSELTTLAREAMAVKEKPRA